MKRLPHHITSHQHHHYHWPSSAVASRLISSGAASRDLTALLLRLRTDMSLRTQWVT